MTLREFGQFLVEHGRDLTVAELKSIPLFAHHPILLTGCVLQLQSVADVADALAAAAGLAWLGKNQDQIAAVGASAQPGAEADGRFKAMEDSWLVQALTRSAEGKLTKDPEKGLPRAEIDAVKLGRLLANGKARELIRSIDLASKPELKAAASAIAGRASHLVKLSVDAGQSRDDVGGGWTKAGAIETGVEFLGSVCEQDYLTANTLALSGNAAYQAKDWLVMMTIEFQGRKQMLVDLLREDAALRAEVLTELSAGEGVTGLNALMQTIEQASSVTFSGEPQLFCADGKDLCVIAPLMPVALPMELLRARAALNSRCDGELRTACGVADQIAEQAEAQLAALKSQKPKSFPGGKDAHTAAVTAAKDALNVAKVAAVSAKKAFVTIPTFTLMMGGSNPQNLASGLSPAIHATPIFTRVYERPVRAEVGNKVFFSKHLVAMPKIALSKVPSVFAQARSGATGRNGRRTLFKEWALEALVPLLLLMDAAKLGEADDRRALHAEALEKLKADTGPKAAFVNGSGLNGNAAEAAFAGLVQEVCESIKTALRNAFPHEAFNDFDDELHSAATAVVLEQRA